MNAFGTPPIYLDYNASTPLDPQVLATMRPFLEEAFGNPSSGHWASTPAKAALERARDQVAALLGCNSDEVVFTSGGSEANNLALKGAFFGFKHKGDHIVTSQVEHPAILGPCRFLERLGASVTYVPVDRTGRINPDDIRRAIKPRTVLISVMHANNEVGMKGQGQRFPMNLPLRAFTGNHYISKYNPRYFKSNEKRQLDPRSCDGRL